MVFVNSLKRIKLSELVFYHNSLIQIKDGQDIRWTIL